MSIKYARVDVCDRDSSFGRAGIQITNAPPDWVIVDESKRLWRSGGGQWFHFSEWVSVVHSATGEIVETVFDPNQSSDLYEFLIGAPLILSPEGKRVKVSWLDPTWVKDTKPSCDSNVSSVPPQNEAEALAEASSS